MRLTALLFLVTTCSYCQQFFKAGLTLSQTTNIPPYGSVHQAISGFVAGIAFNRQWGTRTAIRPEILFIQKGDRLTTSTEELRMRLNYIEIPVLAVLSLMKEEHSTMLAIEAGPSFGYGLGGKYFLTSPGNSQNGAVKFGEHDPNVSTQDIYFENPVDIGIQVGACVTVNRWVLIDIRYGFGLSNLKEPPNPLPAGSTSSDYDMKNGVLQLSMGMTLK
jgi:hypothetical protein